MTKPVVLSEQAITLAELSEDLEKIKARDKEMNMRAAKTDEYVHQIGVNRPQELKYLDKLQKLEIPRLKDQPLMKLVDIKPKSIDEVRQVLNAYTISVSQDNIKKIVDVFASE